MDNMVILLKILRAFNVINSLILILLGLLYMFNIFQNTILFLICLSLFILNASIIKVIRKHYYSYNGNEKGNNAS